MAYDVESEEKGGDYTIVGPGDNLTREYTDRYWGIVQRTLCDIFNAVDCVKKVDKLKKEVEDLEAFDRIMFYHAEPLDVASDLAGHKGSDRVPTVEQKRAYLTLKGVKEQPSDKELAQTTPED